MCAASQFSSIRVRQGNSAGLLLYPPVSCTEFGPMGSRLEVTTGQSKTWIRNERKDDICFKIIGIGINVMCINEIICIIN